MLRSIIVAFAVAALAGPSLARSKAAEFLLNEQIAQTCEGGQGGFDDSAVIERDLDGDGRDDLILNHHGLGCADFAARRCGTQFCSALIYLRRGELLQFETEYLVSEGFTVSNHAIPVLSWYGRIGEGERWVRWNGREFAQE